MLSLPITFISVIGVFAPVFSRPVWQHVKALLTGAVLAPGKRTVTAMLQIMGRSAAPDVQPDPRGLTRAVGSPLTARRLLLRLLVAVFPFRGIRMQRSMGPRDTCNRCRWLRPPLAPCVRWWPSLSGSRRCATCCAGTGPWATPAQGTLALTEHGYRGGSAGLERSHALPRGFFTHQAPRPGARAPT